MVQRFSLLSKLPTLLRRTEVGAPPVALAGPVDLHAIVRDAHHAHELSLGLVVPAGDARAKRNVLRHLLLFFYLNRDLREQLGHANRLFRGFRFRRDIGHRLLGHYLFIRFSLK
jgi:hypothetical protein